MTIMTLKILIEIIKKNKSNQNKTQQQKSNKNTPQKEKKNKTNQWFTQQQEKLTTTTAKQKRKKQTNKYSETKMAQRDAKGRVNWQNLIENLKFFLKVLFLGHIVADKVLLLNSKKTNEQLKKTYI